MNKQELQRAVTELKTILQDTLKILKGEKNEQ